MSKSPLMPLVAAIALASITAQVAAAQRQPSQTSKDTTPSPPTIWGLDILRKQFGYDAKRGPCIAHLVGITPSGPYSEITSVPLSGLLTFPRPDIWGGNSYHIYVPGLNEHYRYIDPTSITATGADRESNVEKSENLSRAFLWKKDTIISSSIVFLRFKNQNVGFPTETNNWLKDQLAADYRIVGNDNFQKIWQVSTTWMKSNPPANFASRWNAKLERFPCVATGGNGEQDN